MRKTKLPTTRKAQKWEKRGFRLLGKLKNEKNEASNYLESSKMKENEVSRGAKARKRIETSSPDIQIHKEKK